MDLLKSPLHDKYQASGAKLINFAGWEMPITFSGLIEEHEAVRDSAGFFDISHMGVISIKGTNPKEIIQKFFSNKSLFNYKRPKLLFITSQQCWWNN